MDREQTKKNHNRGDIIEITRRLHKIKRRLLLEAAAAQNVSIEGRVDGSTSRSVYTKLTCNCRDDDQGCVQ